VADDLHNQSNVVAAWEPGPTVIERDSAAPSSRYAVESSMTATQYFQDEKRATLWATLALAVDGFHAEDVGPRGVPLAVADAGRPELATYLYAEWGHSTRQIAREMEVERETVWSYFNRVRAKVADPEHE
jgi:hypothetical protein